MVSTVTAETSLVSGSRVPERSGAVLDVSSSMWLVDFPLVVLRAVEAAGTTDMTDFASLWSSSAGAYRPIRCDGEIATRACSLPRTVVVHSSLHGGAVRKNFTFLEFASVRNT